MLVKTFSSAVYGIEAVGITIEVNISPGTKYYVVGLPDNAVKESLHRVESAIQSSGFRMPSAPAGATELPEVREPISPKSINSSNSLKTCAK